MAKSSCHWSNAPHIYCLFIISNSIYQVYDLKSRSLLPWCPWRFQAVELHWASVQTCHLLGLLMPLRVTHCRYLPSYCCFIVYHYSALLASLKPLLPITITSVLLPHTLSDFTFIVLLFCWIMFITVHLSEVHSALFPKWPMKIHNHSCNA